MFGRTKITRGELPISPPVELIRRLPKINVGLTILTVAEPFARMLNELELLCQQQHPLGNEKVKVRAAKVQVRKVLRALEMGYELTTPNAHWYCGIVGRNPKMTESSFDLFPCANEIIHGEHRPRLSWFRGLMPISVQERVVEAEAIFGWDFLRVYSPRKEDFQLVNLCLDPVVIGMVWGVPDHGELYFEIARWGTSADLLKQT